MSDPAFRERISVDPAVCHGQACVAGTRIPVSVVLGFLADGLSEDDVVSELPSLGVADVRAAAAYGAALTEERITLVSPGGG